MIENKKSATGTPGILMSKWNE